MQLKQKLGSLINRLRILPKKYTIPGGIFIISAAVYGAVFMIEKPVNFSYAGSTCVGRLTLLPNIHVSSQASGYKVTPAQIVKFGHWPVAAKSLCITAVRPPVPGIAKVTLAPYGGIIARQTLAVRVADPVIADAKVLEQPIPVSRPLSFTLSSQDEIFSYVLKVSDRQVGCVSKNALLSCDVPKLGLAQSKTYPAALIRQFNGKDVATVVSKDIRTLSATALTNFSIKPGEVVYGKPTDIIVGTDKKLVNVEVILHRVDGDERIEVPTSTAVTETGYGVKLAEELPRMASYELITKSVEAIDGSGLVESHTLTFTTSGGPKVVGVNVGGTGVSIGATFAVTFDQTLSDKQDVSKFITLGGGVTFAGRQGDQLLFSTIGVSKCGDFSVKITGDLQSQHEISGHSAWNFASRTVCYTIGTIGTSVQGRPITAYYFGSGTTSVLYTGGIHGSEVSTKSLMDRWIQDLDTKARSIPAHITVVVVPSINPDGIARGTRVNANNVDLNRNFATSDWQKDITTVTNQPFPGGGGESAMSEPETKAISGLAQRLRPKVILSYHSIGGMVAANQAGNSTTLAATYAQLSGYRNITGQSDATFEYSVSGTADDWYAQAIGVPSLLIELGSHSYHQFERNQAAMWAMLQ